MKLPSFAASLVAVVALVLPAASQAQTTVGQLSPLGVPEDYCKSNREFVASSIVAGTSYVMPHAGVITSWSTNTTPLTTGQFLTFKVVRPVPGGYFVVGHDGPRPLTSGMVNTFKTSIGVERGDVLALNSVNAQDVNSACLFRTGDYNDTTEYTPHNADTPDRGLLVTEETLLIGSRLNLQATLLGRPELTSAGPAAGPMAGGTAVALRGSGLAEVQGVSFGGVPALSYRVESESQITAVAPPSATLRAVPISVTTVAGSATAPQSFAYQGCLVPALKDLKLKEAKALIAAEGCALGKVKKKKKKLKKKKKGAKGKVLKQSPAANQLLAPGAPIRLTVVR